MMKSLSLKILELPSTAFQGYFYHYRRYEYELKWALFSHLSRFWLFDSSNDIASVFRIRQACSRAHSKDAYYFNEGNERDEQAILNIRVERSCREKRSGATIQQDRNAFYPGD